MVIHGHLLVLESRRHPGDVGFHLGADRVDPGGRRCCPVLTHACQQGLHARTDIADHRGHDRDIAVHLLGFDIHLDKLLGLITPGRALPMRQEPIEAGTDQHDDIGFFQHQRACRTRRLRVRVRQQPLGHAHRQIGHAALLHQRPDVVIGLRVGGPFPRMISGRWAFLSTSSARAIASGAGS